MTIAHTKPETNRYCIIHGHFYQPPRENPWINVIERQDSAAPYHDWNERIYDECYRPNAYSRILDKNGMIQDIHNNYCNLSFNFGPTLFTWLEDHHPVVTQRILDADTESASRLDGHGNACAQVYNHIIMPHASRRDQLTQIRWAKSFFRSRFNREPEGLWLAETAINMETISCCIEENITFVILSPNQADAFRPLDNDSQWVEITNGLIDTRRPYRLYPYTKNGKRCNGSLDIFFFDEGLSRAASFEDLMINADHFAHKISSAYSTNLKTSETITLVTDGETFGHHKPFTDMCLAYFFRHTAQNAGITPVNFGYFLSHNPPRYEVKLKNVYGEGTAWSCVHGTGRWIRDCGCETGGQKGWNQKWRTPLREALNKLQQQIDTVYENTLVPLVSDPWELRDRYEPFQKGNMLENITALLASFSNGVPPSPEDAPTALRLLEAQKYMLYAFTSCGWFFSDLSGIETIQNLQYACRAIQLGLKISFTSETIKPFFSTLRNAKSNINGTSGEELFIQFTSPFITHLCTLCFTAAVEKVAFAAETTVFSLYGYTCTLSNSLKHDETEPAINCFTVSISNTRTGEDGIFSMLCIYKNHSFLHGYVLPFDINDQPDFNPNSIEQWKNHPKAIPCDLSTLFLESKIMLTDKFLTRISSETLTQYISWIKQQENIFDAFMSMNAKLPEHLHGPVAYLLNTQWDATIIQLKNINADETTFINLRTIGEQAQKYGIALDYCATIPLLHLLISTEMKTFSVAFSTRCIDRMRFLLNIVDRFSIPMPKARLEDNFYNVFSTSISKWYDLYVANKNPVPEQKSLLIQILQFARRMNFNTDKFKIS